MAGMDSDVALLPICMSWSERQSGPAHSTTRKTHVTKERYLKAFDPAVLAAMKNLETSLDMLKQCSAAVQQVN